MDKHKRLSIIILVVLVLFIITACKFPIKLGNKSTGTEETKAPSGGLFSGNPLAATATSAPEIDPNPVGLQEGLGNLDSYRAHFTVSSSDSDGKYSNYEEFLERSVTDDNTYTRTVSTSFDPAEDSEESTSTEEIYNVGLVTCTSSGDDEWSYTDTTDQAKELTDIFKGMIDIVPIIDDPQFVGEETINGVPANHFTFQIQGVGAKSGAVATVNNGEYWLAKDGQYIVKYLLDLEVHSAAADSGTDTWDKLGVTVDVTDINSDIVEFTLPANCVKQ